MARGISRQIQCERKERYKGKGTMKQRGKERQKNTKKYFKEREEKRGGTEK